jgi:hypothetical protein
MEELLVALTETLPIIRDRWRWNRRIAEAWMTVEGRRPAVRYIPAGGFKAVVITLLEDLIDRSRGRRIVGYRIWMRASGQQHRKEQSCSNKSFLHRNSRSIQLRNIVLGSGRVKLTFAKASAHSQVARAAQSIREVTRGAAAPAYSLADTHPRWRLRLRVPLCLKCRA